MAAAKLHDKLFISQQVLESWVESGKVTFDDRLLTILASKKSYRLAPALRFLGLLDGSDAAKLIGKVRLIAQIKDLGGEHVADSCLIGENAYQVEEGFIGEVLAEQVTEAPVPKPAPVAAAPAPQAAPAAPAAPRAGEKASEDTDLLTKFLLDNLNM